MKAPNRPPQGLLLAYDSLVSAVTFCCLALVATANTSNWRAEPSTIPGMIAGAMIGLLIGYVLDSAVTQEPRRWVCLQFAWMGVLIAIAAFWLLDPALQHAR